MNTIEAGHRRGSVQIRRDGADIAAFPLD